MTFEPYYGPPPPDCWEPPDLGPELDEPEAFEPVYFEPPIWVYEED